MFKKLLLAGAAATLMMGSAQAADIIEPTAYDWTGPYIGLQAGYAWGENDVSFETLVAAAAARGDPVVLNPPGDGSIEIDGFIGGLHAGYNFQSGSFVFGFEGDVEYADLSGKTDVLIEAGDEEPVAEIQQDIDWLASLRLRAGVAMDRALIYATGGLAGGGVDMTLISVQNGEFADESTTAWGWTIGGGLEYAFTEELSARAEYRYTELEDTDVFGDGVTSDFENSFHAVRAGLSWHLAPSDNPILRNEGPLFSGPFSFGYLRQLRSGARDANQNAFWSDDYFIMFRGNKATRSENRDLNKIFTLEFVDQKAPPVINRQILQRTGDYMFKKLLLAGAASALMMGGAQAADVIEPTVYDWTGPYIGLQGGYAWGENDVSVEPEQLSLAARGDPVVFDPPEDGSIEIDGFVGGLHAGYNFQSDSFVFGFEGDVEYADLSGKTDMLNEPDTEPFGDLQQDIDWLASLRLRAGVAMDRALFYATGGLAVGGVDMKITDEVGSVDDSETAWGWTIGGGVEYAFTDDLSARIEYRYTELEDTELSFDNIDIADGDVKFENAFHAVRAGLSWHF